MKRLPRQPLCDLIFDLDGTLVDSCMICVDILQTMLVERGSGHRIDPMAARAFMSQGGARMVSALLGPACGDPAQELAEFRRRYATRPTDPASLYPGVVEGLTRLADRGHRLAICSNKPQNLCEKVLADTGLDGLFDAVVGGRADLRAKPHPDLLVETLRLMGSDARDCLFIGDSELDHQVAQGADMPFYFLTYGYADADYRPLPGTAHDDFTSLTGALAGRTRTATRKALRA
jgi:phosphoglycolate phosphatase